MDNYDRAVVLRRQASQFECMAQRARSDADSFTQRGYTMLALASEQRACSLEDQAEQLHNQAADLVRAAHPAHVPNYPQPHPAAAGW